MGCERMHPRVPCKYRCASMLIVPAIAICLAMAGLLIALGAGVVRGRVRAAEFKETNCTALNGTIGEETRCKCGKNCHSTFPCAQVLVEYTLPIDDQRYGPFVIHQTCDNLRSHPECSADHCKRSKDENREEIMVFYTNLLSRNESFPCRYNPEKLDEVFIHCNEMIIHHILWPAIFFVLFLVLSVVLILLAKKGVKLSRAIRASEKQNGQESSTKKCGYSMGFAPWYVGKPASCH